MGFWQIAGIVMVAVVLVFVLMFLVVKKIIDNIFKRVERPNYSSLLQFKDVKKEYPQELLRFQSGKTCYKVLNQGYQVFAYDNTGYHLSEGKNCVGLPQAVEDLDAALSFVEQEPRFEGLPVYLFGHSWGGYAIGAVLNFNHKVKAVVSVSGFNNPNKMIVEWAKRMAGVWAYLAIPFLVLHQRLSFGKKMDIMAVNGINKADVPVLLVHGSKDTTVRLDGSATFSLKEEITNQKVRYILWDKEQQNGHLDVLYQAGAKAYGLQISKEYSELLKKTKNKLTEEDKAEFFANVDKETSSAPNEELMKKIVEFYEQA